MSTVGSNILNCEDVQAELNLAFLTCGHEFMSPDSPFLGFVTSSENSSQLQQLVNPGGNKTRIVNLRYDQKVSASSVTEVEACELTCTSENKVGDLVASYEMNICEKVLYDEGYNIYDFARNCKRAEDYLRKRLLIMASALEEKIAIKTAEEAVALYGKWGKDVKNIDAGSQALEIQTRLSGGISLNPTFMSKINLAIKQTGFCSSIGIFGSSELWEATDNLNVGCCADSGFDLMAVLQRYGKAVMYDPYIVDAFASDNIALLTQLGALQMLTYTVGTEANFEAFTTKGSDFELIPMFTPKYGIPFDLVVSNHCGNISFIVSTSTKLVSAPLDMFPVGDRNEGVNFTSLINVVAP